MALIVHPDGDARSTIVRSLRDAGFQAVGVAGFEAAKHLLGAEPIDLLVTEARLGDFHGVHLVMLARSTNPAIFAAVLTSEPDVVLSRDVEAAGAALFVGDRADALVSEITRRLALMGPSSGLLQ